MGFFSVKENFPTMLTETDEEWEQIKKRATTEDDGA